MIGKSRLRLVFLPSALIWLLISCCLQQLRAIELLFPSFFPVWLTFGRVDFAAEAAFLYGWGCCAAFAVGFGICAVGSMRLVAVVAFFWNVAVAIGVVLILSGNVILAPTLPAPLNFFLLLLTLFLCTPILRNCLQAGFPCAIAQRWLLASFFLLPWLFFTAATLLREGILKGAARLPVEAWFHEGFLWLWLGGSALGFAYYLISKILSTALVEERLAPVGFWVFFSASLWASLRTIAGGAVPAWVSAAGTSANLLLWVPIAVIWKNLCGTLRRFTFTLESSPGLRFIALGARAFVLCAIQAILLYSKSASAFLQFTDFSTAQALFTRYGFLTPIFLGGFYYFAPRVLLREWPTKRAIYWHFHLHRVGLVLGILPLILGGIVQGVLLNNPAVPFSASISAIFPWRCIASMGWAVFFFAQIIFVLHCVRLFWPNGVAKGG